MKSFVILAVLAALILFVNCDRVVNINGQQSVHIYQNNDDRGAATTTEQSAFVVKSSPRNSPSQPQYSFNFNDKVFEANSMGNILSIGNGNSFYKSMEQSFGASTVKNSLAETTNSNENESGENREHFEAEEMEADLRAQRRRNNLG